MVRKRAAGIRKRAKARADADVRASLTVDTSGVEATVQEAEEVVKMSAVAMISAIRQAAQMGVFLAQIFGVAIDQMMALMIETALLTIELAITSIAAFQVGGYAAIITGKAAYQLAAIMSMLFLIGEIRQKKIESAQQIQGIVSAFRMASFR